MQLSLVAGSTCRLSLVAMSNFIAVAFIAQLVFIAVLRLLIVGTSLVVDHRLEDTDFSSCDM